MTENDGSTLRPEARDDVMFDLRGVAELLEVNGGTMNATLAQRVRASIAVLDEVAFVPICDLYELARIPGLLDAADSDFDACAMDIVDEETGENHRDNGFARLKEAVTVLTSHLPLQGMLEQESGADPVPQAPTDTQLPRIEDIKGGWDSLRDLARKEERAEAERKAASLRAEERNRKDAAWRIRDIIRVTLPEGWMSEMESRGVELVMPDNPAQSWETIVRAIKTPSKLTFPIRASLCRDANRCVRVTIHHSKDGGFAVDFIPRVIDLTRQPGPDHRLPYGWREDKEGHPRASDADRPALARMLYRALELEG